VIDARTALQRLREGNQRFARGARAEQRPSRLMQRPLFVEQQAPFAIVLGCADSRVPAELVFDQGFGDLFVIRVAGNIVAPSQVGSVEFAATRYDTRLVVVMGHTQCGAILATIEELEGTARTDSRNLRAIVDRVRPSVETLLAARPDMDHDTLVHHAVRANVRASVDHLRHGSPLLEQLIRDEGLAVVGAEYSLETGEVEFLDDMVPVAAR
jgi:carbonic anhydrase